MYFPSLWGQGSVYTSNRIIVQGIMAAFVSIAIDCTDIVQRGVWRKKREVGEGTERDNVSIKAIISLVTTLLVSLVAVGLRAHITSRSSVSKLLTFRENPIAFQMSQRLANLSKMTAAFHSYRCESVTSSLSLYIAFSFFFFKKRWNRNSSANFCRIWSGRLILFPANLSVFHSTSDVPLAMSIQDYRLVGFGVVLIVHSLIFILSTQRSTGAFAVRPDVSRRKSTVETRKKLLRLLSFFPFFLFFKNLLCLVFLDLFVQRTTPRHRIRQPHHVSILVASLEHPFHHWPVRC